MNSHKMPLPFKACYARSYVQPMVTNFSPFLITSLRLKVRSLTPWKKQIGTRLIKATTTQYKESRI